MSEIIGVEKEVTIDIVEEYVERFVITQNILGVKASFKKKDYPDGGFVITVKRDDEVMLKVGYGDIQVNVDFTLHQGIDNSMIATIKKLAEADKDDWDRFWVDEEKGSYGAIFIGYKQFEEMFPKMYQ